jgi:two-component system NarL family sensor kinase
VFRNRLDQEAKIALYRVAQEALTNIERHSGADAATIKIYGHRNGATLEITDNGQGLEAAARTALPTSGLGLRNMQERIEQLGGRLNVSSSSLGTTIEAEVPLNHLLPPEGSSRKARA